jgi:L-ascorbate metabolism protein UlaG (beta-lactamase superfamily)
MRFQLVRSATLLLNFGGHHLLIDPYFAPKHSRPSFTGKSPNPLVDLPMSTEQILEGVELVIVSHLHSDHFDPVAHTLVPKDLPLICQPGDEQNIRDKGFQDVTPLTDKLDWQGIQITRTAGHHGTGEVETIMGNVMGFVLEAKDEPIFYWAGDTVLCDEVQDVIARFQPNIIVSHSCGAMWLDSAGQRHLIVMDTAQTVELCGLAPKSTIIATHMDSLDHATISRAELREQAQQANIDNTQLRIPDDGESIEFSSP